MPVRIRLQRHGKKGKPFYWVVAADVRSKRDGKFLEKLGIYNPNTNPATIELNVDNSVQWLVNGAQPSDTARRILSYKGVMYKHHLLGGVRKGALTEEQAEEKFNAWVAEKEKAIAKKTAGLDKEKADAKAKALEAEKEINEKRAMAAAEVATEEAEIAESPIEVTEEGGAQESVVEEVVEEVKTEEAAPAKAEEVVEEVKTEEAAPAKAEEVVEEAKTEEAAPAKAEEVAEEVKAEEPETAAEKKEEKE
ncbi:30S ribosomal protein S16 [uncultured Eudoraea sp.]|uniref:30S ribosomal protein S16 n=1 Tax=uncultured Eudoraea sp. TaxID=1035614 RepID=UPI0026291222|nr:30S ribosomal protein S16 [uncultured Eudoraea sp.]